jgi:hypothetical protein
MPDPIDGLRHPRKAKDDFLQYLRKELFTLNFYRAHMLYFIVVIAISSVIMYGVGIAHGPKEYRADHLTYMDALFLCTSAMTTTGTSRCTWPLNCANCFRAQHSQPGRPRRIPTGNIVCLDDLGKHTFCVGMGSAHTTDAVPEEDV